MQLAGSSELGVRKKPSFGRATLPISKMVVPIPPGIAPNPLGLDDAKSGRLSKAADSSNGQSLPLVLAPR